MGKVDHRHYSVPLKRLPAHCCKWPVEERKRVVGLFLFCGKRQQPGSVYCEEHHGIAYPPHVPRVRAR